MDNHPEDSGDVQPHALNEVCANDCLYGFVHGDGKCWRCSEGKAHMRRQNTKYEDDIRNWVQLCDSCAIENEKHWDEMWSDYYSGIL